MLRDQDWIGILPIKAKQSLNLILFFFSTKKQKDLINLKIIINKR